MNENRSEVYSKKRRNRKILYFFIGVFLILYAMFWNVYLKTNNTVNEIFNSVEIQKKRESDVAIKATQPISFAFFGIDNGAQGREEMAGRSDAILVGTVNPKTSTTTLVSIPRDTYAWMVGYNEEYEPYFYDKLTHAYAFGEATMAINSVQELLGIPIDYYVEINMQGLIDIVDALDGIEVTSPLTFDYHRHYFTEGETRILNGKEALAFSQMRKTDPEGDFGRQKREKLIVQAILNKALSLDSVRHYENILTTVEDNVKTNLTFKDMTNIVMTYGHALENFRQDNLSGSELWLEGVYYLYAHPNDRLELSNMLRKELELPEITLEELHLSNTDYYQLEYVDNSY